MLWVAGFDVIYALQDESFDKERGLKSIPAALGSKGARVTSMALHGGAVVMLVRPVVDARAREQREHLAVPRIGERVQLPRGDPQADQSPGAPRDGEAPLRRGRRLSS